ncbi:hypothetical protein BJX63DRAFT_406369 [Aspergillus granulosus]|uniref:Uncharacterized protein n=1 Tax=Aspergillus granulosus TaxID=176169 RepID=A0ABR4H1B1_9EURO
MDGWMMVIKGSVCRPGLEEVGGGCTDCTVSYSRNATEATGEELCLVGGDLNG